MSRALAVVALLLCACGPGIDGTWRMTSTAKDQTGADKTVVQDVIILPPPLAWKAGGGCEAPLSETSHVARLTTANWTCPLQSGSGLPFPFTESSTYQWKQGDVLVVKNATFTLGSDDQLAIDVSLQVQTEPNNPSAGITLDWTTQPGHGATRVK